jgi:hypothetical protein
MSDNDWITVNRMIDSPATTEIAEEANKIIEQAKKCTERGEGRGKCHVFLDGSLICECEDVDLAKERLR